MGERERLDIRVRHHPQRILVTIQRQLVCLVECQSNYRTGNGAIDGHCDLVRTRSSFPDCTTSRLLPEASTMLVMTASLCQGFGTAMIVATGVSTANLFWIFLVASGTVALAHQFPTAFFGSIAIGTSICLLDCLEPGV